MGKTILEEAIEDVQALKKAAEENAKNVLVEALSPSIKSFISAHLGDHGLTAKTITEAVAGQNETEKMMPHNTGDVIIGKDVSDEKREDEGTMYEDNDHDEDEEDDEDEDDDDKDMDEQKKSKVEDKDEMEDEKDCKDMKEGDESIEVTTEELKKAFSEVLKSGISTQNEEASFKDAQDPNDGEYGLVHKIPGEVVWSDADKVLGKAKNAKMVTKEDHDKVVKELQQEIAQYSEAFKHLKKNLSEMNVFNAKLLYTTKLLQNNMSNKTKLSVIEAIDKAQTVQQAELVYETLSETFKIAGVLDENKSNKIKGPKASRMTQPSSTLNEAKNSPESVQLNRWQELAGIVD